MERRDSLLSIWDKVWNLHASFVVVESCSLFEIFQNFKMVKSIGEYNRIPKECWVNCSSWFEHQENVSVVLGTLGHFVKSINQVDIRKLISLHHLNKFFVLDHRWSLSDHLQQHLRSHEKDFVYLHWLLFHYFFSQLDLNWSECIRFANLCL